MPHEHPSGKMVVTYNEVVPVFYTPSNLKVILWRYQDKPNGPKRVQLGGNGRQLLIDFDSLPPHIQHALGDPRNAVHVFEKYYRIDKEAVSFFTKHQLPDGSYLRDVYQDTYIVNASVLKAIICFRSDLEKERKRKGLNTVGIAEVLRVHTIDFQKTLKAKFNVQHTLPESLKRFKQVLKDFEKQGYGSLISGKHGNDNSRKVTDRTPSLLESLFATDTTKPAPTEVHRRYDAFITGNVEIVNNDSGEIYKPADFKKLCKATVTNYLSDWQSAIGTYAARGGDRQKNIQLFKAYHSLNKPKSAGSLLSIDDRQPPFKLPDGKRIWFYNGIDLASEAFTCWVYGKTKEGIILEFYRQLVRNYAEWGLCLPYELEAEMSLNSSFTGTFLREGAMFQEVRIEANNARGKRIEAYYRQLRYGLEKKREGWLARPFAISESNQAGNHEAKALHYDEIVNGCLQDIETWNNTPHSVHTHLSRWEVFMQMQHPDLKPINYNAILLHLGYKTPTSCHTGIIKLQGSEFLLGENGQVVFGEKLISLMKRVEGCNVDGYWLDDNLGKVLKALVYIGDLLICEAVYKPTYNRAKLEQTDEDRLAREIMSKYVATIDAYGRNRKKAIEPVTVIDNTPKPKKTFTIPGLKVAPVINGWGEATALPDLTDENEMPPLTPGKSFVKPLKDRL